MTDTYTADEADIIDVEGEEEPQTAAIAPREGPGASAALFGTTDPVEVLQAARRAAEALVDVLEDRKLYKEIRNKKHVFIEGWLMLAGMLQISTPNVWVRPIEEGGKRIGWEARYEARAANGRILSSAEGECRRTEERWEDRDEHALRSMAQTRAQSKALASALRWVVELGGFAGTPAEEMSDDSGGGKSPYVDNAECPACGSKVYDNRGDERTKPKDEGGKGWPVFKCANSSCTGGSGDRPWASWDRQAFTPEETKAKQTVYNAVAGHEQGWRNYYELDAPDYDPDERALLETIHESGDLRQMAGFLWNRLMSAAATSDAIADHTDMTARDYRTIGLAAVLAMQDAERDEPSVLLELDAINSADEQLQDAEVDAHYGMSDYR